MAQNWKRVKVGNYFEIGNDLPFTLIAGPCQLESKEHALFMAGELTKIAKDAGINFIFKASFDKANRTAKGNARGVGLDTGLEIFQEIKDKFNIPVITDVHEINQVEKLASVVDIIQIPSLLSRQTDLIAAAAATGKVVNIKKGQFMGPSQAKYLVEKAGATQNNIANVILTDRGSCFGFDQLVSDPTFIIDLARPGYPVVMDCTHAVQRPAGQGSCSGGNRDMAEVYGRSALSTGICGGIFIECHDDPDNAKSDGPNSVRLDYMPTLLKRFKDTDSVAKKIPFDKF
ncbi:MAG: 3-deoxy-8-phosphooctulonate synthase [Rickettsiales bacterium]|jgi:2-dehydro-3-deoxyphosphooctonate aldolase (KDO 8-P synthase)|nr:3-deoxy-8-phosphooctulonate synthase [Rickettsiales bacterium]